MGELMTKTIANNNERFKKHGIKFIVSRNIGPK